MQELIGKKQKIYISGKSRVVHIQETFIDNFLADANGDYVKVYLMVLKYMNEPECLIEDIAAKLEFTPRKIIKALQYWDSVGVLKITTDNNNISTIEYIDNLDKIVKSEDITTADVNNIDEIIKDKISDTQSIVEVENKDNSNNIPLFSDSSYSEEDILALSQDEDFIYLATIYSTYNKRPLNEKEKSALLYMYKDLSFSKDLIDYLLESSFNKGVKNVSSYIVAIAYDWATRNIFTVDEAQNYSSIHKNVYYDFMKNLGFSGKLTPVHIETFEEWMKDHDTEMIIEACKLSIKRIGKGDITYVSKILEDWKKKGIKTVLDIDKDKPVKSKAKVGNFNNFQKRDKDYKKEFMSFITREVNEVR